MKRSVFVLVFITFCFFSVSLASSYTETIKQKPEKTSIKNMPQSEPVQLLTNGSFEKWSGGKKTAPDGWTLDAGRVTQSINAKIGTFSAAINRSGKDADMWHTARAGSILDKLRGKTATFSCWVSASRPKQACIVINDGAGKYLSSPYHSGKGEWELLKVTLTIGNSAKYVDTVLYVVNTDGTAYFDGATLVEGRAAMPYIDKK